MKRSIQMLFGVMMVIFLSAFYLGFFQRNVSTAAVGDDQTSVQKTLLAEPSSLTGYMYDNGMNHTCLDNWTSWPNSKTFNPDAPWSTAFVAISANPLQYVGDINGDSLPDYMTVTHIVNSKRRYTYMADCVYLNNGHGWDLVYRCINSYYDYGTPTTDDDELIYYGDCAG